MKSCVHRLGKPLANPCDKCGHGPCQEVQGALAIHDPQPGQVYEHRNGQTYEVLYIANEDSNRADYPVTVVYRNRANGKVHAKQLYDWKVSVRKGHRWIRPMPATSIVRPA